MSRQRRIRYLLLALVGVLVVAVAAGAVAYRRLNRNDTGPAAALRRSSNPPAVVADQSEALGPIVVSAVDHGVFDPELTISVTAPGGATEMQVGFDATFGSTPWVPVSSEYTLAATNQGYQIVYARFRGPDGPIGPVSVAGVDVDATAAAATSSADGRHRPSWVRPLSSTALVVRIEAGRLDRGSLVLYDLDNPPDGDRVTLGIRGPVTVERNGETMAAPVSERDDVVREFDRLIGQDLPRQELESQLWTVTSSTDPNFADPVRVSATVLTSPTGGGMGGDGQRIWPKAHDVILQLPAAIQTGNTYQIEPPSDRIESTTLVFDDHRTLSPSLHVNQVGFSGDDAKMAVLGPWTVGLEPAGGEVDFVVVDHDSGQVVFEGRGQPSTGSDEMGQGDLSGSLAVDLDFSPLRQPGRYRVCVASIGCSYPFAVSDSVWTDLTVLVARAAYHQRSGIGTGPPHTSVIRPPGYRPQDGATVVASEQSLLDARLNPGSAFADLVERSTGEEVVEAWGGHFDAGDWDRRVEHLWFVRSVAQLVRGHPDIFAELELNIPESGNGIPDLLDEGLWSLDLYRRMQTDDGGVRGGIEASEHPPVNATSWTDDLAVFAFEPDPWSTFLYASVAAEVSLTLRPYDPELAEQYLASALAAYAWADGRLRELADEAQPGNDDAVALVRSQKNVAAAALLLTTGDAGWHDDFVDTAEFLTGDDRMMSCHRHTQCDAGWLYLEADESVTDPAIRAEVADRFVDSADAIVNAASSTKYGWTTENPFVPLIWGLGAGGTPHSSGLLKAYQLTGDERYRNAVLQSASFTLGLNPTNRVYLTGIGRQPVRHPLIVDTLHGGVPVWPGTPVYGPHQLEEGGPSQWGLDGVLRPGGAHPDPVSVPYLWQWYDVSNLAFFTEYTMHQSHSEALLAFATLAATS